MAADVRGRSHKIIADVNITSDAHGVIFAHGSRFGGHALFIKDRKLYYIYNFLGIKADNVSEEYEAPYALTDGTILGVAVDVSEEIYLDLEQEAMGAMARD